MREFDWKNVRRDILEALRKSVDVHDVYLIDIEDDNIITICVIAAHISHLRPLVRMRLIDKLIEKNNPILYDKYLFCYEIWDMGDWNKQTVGTVVERGININTKVIKPAL